MTAKIQSNQAKNPTHRTLTLRPSSTQYEDLLLLKRNVGMKTISKAVFHASDCFVDNQMEIKHLRTQLSSMQSKYDSLVTETSGLEETLRSLLERVSQGKLAL